MAKPVNGTPPLPYPTGNRDAWSLGAFDQDLTKALHAYLSELAFRLNGALPKDGTEPMTGDLDMGGFSIINTPGGAPGDVFGPAGATDNNPAVFDGVTGKLIKEVTYSTFKTSLSLTKSDVGLSNVDNTSDLSKPVSTATQTALNLKADLASPALTGNPTAPTPSPGDNDTSIATTAFVTAANPDASTTTKGHVELATNAETGGKAGGTDTVRVVTPDDMSFHSGKKETRLLSPSGVSSINALDLGTNWAFIRITWHLQAAVDQGIGFRISYDNGANWESGTYNHYIDYLGSVTPTTARAAGPATATYASLAHTNTLQDDASNAWGTRGEGVLFKPTINGNAGTMAFRGSVHWVNNTPELVVGDASIYYSGTTTSTPNALQFLTTTGNMSGYVLLEIYYA